MTKHTGDDRDGSWYVPAPALPVEGGLRAHSQSGQFTRSWWAGRWLRALIQWVNPTRLARGRAYARQGQVMDLDVQVGLVTAHVQGSRPRPYCVRIESTVFADDDWERIVDALAGQAMYAAQLLNGEMPLDVEQAFSAAGVSLFPASTQDLRIQCSCPDDENPCKHVAAVYYLLGERLDEDPFLLFVLRGRTREQIMSALRARRANRSPGQSAGEGAADGVALENSPDTFWQIGAAAAAVQIHVAPPEVHMEAIRVLGEAEFGGDEPLEDRLDAVYRLVSQRAVEVAFGGVEPEEESPCPGNCDDIGTDEGIAEET